MTEKWRMPLNSRRVTRSQLRAVAEELGLPTSATGEDLAQMVSGKLTEEGRDPKNTQVVVSNDQLQLEDEHGVFLTATLTEEEEQRTDPEQESDDRKKGAVKTIDPPKKSFSFYRQRRQTWNRG